MGKYKDFRVVVLSQEDRIMETAVRVVAMMILQSLPSPITSIQRRLLDKSQGFSSFSVLRQTPGVPFVE